MRKRITMMLAGLVALLLCTRLAGGESGSSTAIVFDVLVIEMAPGEESKLAFGERLSGFKVAPLAPAVETRPLSHGVGSLSGVASLQELTALREALRAGRVAGRILYRLNMATVAKKETSAKADGGTFHYMEEAGPNLYAVKDVNTGFELSLTPTIAEHGIELSIRAQLKQFKGRSIIPGAPDLVAGSPIVAHPSIEIRMIVPDGQTAIFTLGRVNRGEGRTPNVFCFVSPSIGKGDGFGLRATTDEKQIARVVADFWESIDSDDLSHLQDISPIMRIFQQRGQTEETIGLLKAQRGSGRKKDIDFAQVFRMEIDDNAGDALAFVTDPTEDKNPVWYYLRKQKGKWLIWIYEDWPAPSAEQLFKKCREAVDKAPKVANQ